MLLIFVISAQYIMKDTTTKAPEHTCSTLTLHQSQSVICSTLVTLNIRCEYEVRIATNTIAQTVLRRVMPEHNISKRNSQSTLYLIIKPYRRNLHPTHQSGVVLSD